MEGCAMTALEDITTTTEIRFPLTYSSHTVATIAAHVGSAESDTETLLILGHIDREVHQLAHAVTLDAVHARIADLVRTVQSAHQPSEAHDRSTQ